MTQHTDTEAIVSALEKSGYLMEQEVATQLEELDFHVWTNWAFRDVEQGKSRELDVRAIRRIALNESQSLGAFVELLVECKNNSNPYVFLRRPKSEVDNRYPPQEFVFPISEYERRQKVDAKRTQVRRVHAFHHLGFADIHHQFVSDSKVVQFCQLFRKGKHLSANHGGLYDATFFPMAKALMERRKEIARGNVKYFWLLVPMVVLRGEMFCVDSSVRKPTPMPTDHVTFKREIRARTVDGTFAVEFVRQSGLSAFIDDCLGPLVSRMLDLINHDASKVLKTELPWEE